VLILIAATTISSPERIGLAVIFLPMTHFRLLVKRMTSNQNLRNMLLVQVVTMAIWILQRKLLVVTVVRIIHSIYRMTDRKGSFSPSFPTPYLDV
jgi:hypothetical protein